MEVIGHKAPERPVVQEPLAASRGTGSVAARFALVRGATRLTHSACTAPLKIAKSFAREHGAVEVCLMDCSPGLLAGDRYEMSWRLEEGARVFLTNQSFTKVHPSSDNPCSQRQRITVAAGARLEYLPQPVMLYRDAGFSSSCAIDIEPGGVVVISDIICAGRIARREAFAFDSYRGRMQVRYGGDLVFCNQISWQPRQQKLTARGAWEEWTHWGNLSIWSDHLDPRLVQSLRDVAEAPPEVCCGVSSAYRHGVVVALLGRRAWDIQQLVQRLIEVMR